MTQPPEKFPNEINPDKPGMTMDKLAIDTTEALVAQISPILRDHGPSIQSAVLGDLVAMWLAGLHQPGSDAATLTIRTLFLNEFTNLVRVLTPINAKALDVPAPQMPPPDDDATRLRTAVARENEEICQLLGAALGYPRFCDDPANFPDATPEHGVCVGDHVAVTIAAEAANRLNVRAAIAREWTPDLEANRLQLCKQLVSVVDHMRAPTAKQLLTEAERALTLLADIIGRIKMGQAA